MAFLQRGIIRLAAILLAAGGVHTWCAAQSKSPAFESIDPKFQTLLDTSQPFEQLPIDLKPNKAMQVDFGKFEHFTEGPLWSPAGYLLFSDIYGDQIYRWSPGTHGNTFRADAGYPNGLTFDQQGRLLICNQKLRRVERLEKDGTVTVLADNWQGKKLNAPNDIVVRKDGTIYFTDPFWKFPPGSVQELSFQAIWRIDKNGKLSIAAQDFGLPNGIAFSPDEKTLYLGDTSRHKLYAFAVQPDGALTDRRLFVDLVSTEKGAVDGMKVDEQGNVYTTGPAGVWVFSPQGKHLGTLHPPAQPANLAWGGADYRTLYLAMPSGVYSIRMKVKGLITYPTNAEKTAVR
jgi:sugar lactone lactonase YvrE